MLFGWNFEQWAVALARFGVKHVRNAAEAVDVRKRWKIRYYHEPLENEFIGVEPEKDYIAAVEVFSNVRA